MEDQKIIALFFARKEQAIQETDRKYGGFCYCIANRILNDPEDSQETVSDTYLSAWQAIPPQRPKLLKAFLGRISRNFALNRWQARKTEKRGGGEIPLALEELGDCISQGPTVEQSFDAMQLRQALRKFIAQLEEQEKRVFLQRYWYLESIADVSRQFGFSESKTASMLFRTRKKLKKYLVQEGLL